MKKLFFLLPIILLADIDPFKAGDLTSSSPYGLTPQEKAILQNKKNIQKNIDLINELKKNLNDFKSKLVQKFVEYDQSISDLSNKLSSFDTILSEIDATKISLDKLKKELKDVNLTDMKIKIKLLEQNITQIQHKITFLEAQNKAIKKTIEEITKIQNENFQNLSSSIQTILKQLKNLNNQTSKLNPKTAFEKAKRYYFSGKFDKAKELFLYSISKKHLPATSLYYLGEISYKQGKYKKALAFYKKSITLYPKKTSFTDRLLYHTGISFLKLKQKKNAKLTFQKLINDFPNSKYSALAKKELEK